MGEKLYLQKRPDTGTYRYVRRVPTEVHHLVSETIVKIGLKTSSLAEAAQKAKELNGRLERYWQALAAGETGDEVEKRRAAIEIVTSMGFGYQRMDAIVSSGADEMVPRLKALAGNEENLPVARALLGSVGDPSLTVSGMAAEYQKHKQPDFAGYSEKQIERHMQAKERAAAYLLEALKVDKALPDLTRDDALKYRAWWNEKRQRDKLTVDAPNRAFSDIQGMMVVIDTALKTKFRDVWGGLRFKGTRQTRSKKRATYASDFIQSAILRPGALDSVNQQARLIFYTLIETGARPSEICNIKPQHIHLDAEVPYIDIEEQDRILKSENAIRQVPLVGVSLWAMRHAPGGFPNYHDKEDSFSATMNKALRVHNLRPTPRHTVYSIRHAYSDRILDAGATDRLQTDLMGHEFGRPKYGDGAALKKKVELLDRIKFAWDMETPLAD